MPDQLVLMFTSMSKSFIIIIAGAVLFFDYLINDAKRISFSKHTYGISGAFFNLKFIDKLRLSFEFIKLLYVVACLLEFKQFDLVHLVFYILLVAIILVLNITSINGFTGFIYNVIIFASLYLINALQTYRSQMYSKTGFNIIIIATSIFIALFAYYQFVSNINNIMIRREKRNVQ